MQGNLYHGGSGALAHCNNLISTVRTFWCGQKKRKRVKLRIHLNFVDDINEEIFLDVQLSFHFVDPKAAQFITGDPGFAIVAPNESDINVPNLEILNTRSCEHREQVSGVYANRHSVRVSVVPCVYPREVAICSLSF